MRAKKGDWIRVMGHHTGDPDRRGLVEEVRGENGGPPYSVRWLDNDHLTLFFPGSDAVVEEPDVTHS